MDGGPGSPDPGRLVFSAVSLRQMVEMAWKLEPWQIVRPGWVDTNEYDLSAIVPKGATLDQCRAMLQRLLTERFAMTVRTEQRPTNVYVLQVAKGGLKMLPAQSPLPPDSPESRGRPKSLAPGTIHIGGEKGMAGLTELAARQLGSPVIDQTGLKGKFRYSLDYAPGNRLPFGPGGTLRPGSDSAATPAGENDIVRAYEEQLGLRLEPRKLPVDTLIIDKASKVPAAPM